jgi:hypothetical protein
VIQSWSFGHINRTVELLRIFPAGRERLPDVSEFRHDPLVMVGADVTIPLSDSVVVVPAATLYWVWRSDERGVSEPPEHGLGARIITIGVGVQFGGVARLR